MSLKPKSDWLKSNKQVDNLNHECKYQDSICFDNVMDNTTRSGF
jgi:hypothetical protein